MRAHPQRPDGGLRGLSVILRSFHRADQGRRSAGNDADHQLGRSSERRRAFRSIEHAQTAAGPGPYVDKPATCPESCLHQIDGSGNVQSGPGHCRRNRGILGADEIYYLQR